jgi:hypothetical protein
MKGQEQTNELFTNISSSDDEESKHATQRKPIKEIPNEKEKKRVPLK